MFRKDLLWKNFRRMQLLYGKEAFGFHPDTFYLPAEQKQLIERWRKLFKKRLSLKKGKLQTRENYEMIYIVKLNNNFCFVVRMKRENYEMDVGRRKNNL